MDMQKTLAVINLRAIEQNALKVKSLLGGRKFYAVVKADAYGHGAERVALALQSVADGFCVAIAEEGVALRLAGVTLPILVLTPPLDEYDASRCAYYGLTATVNSVETAELCRGLGCHVKVNTGMNRLGCSLSELPALLSKIKGENLLGVYSHLYAAESGEDCAAQLALFDRAEGIVKKINPQAMAHIAASGGILRGGKYLKDGARCGILLYGYAPVGFQLNGIYPAMKVYARRIQTHGAVGLGAGYGRMPKLCERLSAYRCGYAEGLFRTVPLGINNLCMDSFVSQDTRDLAPVMENAEEYAERCGTISYEVLCKASLRAEKIYER